MRELEGVARELLVDGCPLNNDVDTPTTLSECRECEYFNTEFSDKITCMYEKEDDGEE